MGVDQRRLLLLSNSTQHGQGYLDYVASQFARHYAGVRRIVFAGFALHDRDGYAATFSARMASLGLEVDALHRSNDPQGTVERAEAMFVGGGNTFRLLDTLQRYGLIDAIRARVHAGMPYGGASAGSVIAAPTIRTTNDMPIVQPVSLDALGLIEFQINAHYVDPDPGSAHMGETRAQRLQQYLEENVTPVLGLREGTWLEVHGRAIVLQGSRSARLFRRNHAEVEIEPGTDLGAELDETTVSPQQT